MKKSFKHASLALCVAMALPFTACGNPSNVAPAATTAPAAEATAAPTAAPASNASGIATAPIGDQTTPYTVDMYFCGIEPPEGTQRISDAMSKYVQQTYNTNTSYAIHFLNWGTYDQTLNPMIAAGQKFDTAYTNFGWGVNYRELGPQGAFVDWTPYLDQVPSWHELLKPYEEKIKNYTSNWAPQDAAGNKTVGVWLVPTFHDLAIQQGLEYNETEAQKYGLVDQIKAVKSIDDLTPIMDAYHKANPAGYGFFTADGSIFKICNTKATNTMTRQQFYEWYEWYDDKTDSYIPSWTDQSWQHCVDILNQWYKAGYIADSQLTDKNSDITNKASDWLLWVNTNKPGWYASSNANAATKGFSINLVGMGPVVMGMENVLGAAISISKTSANPERAAYAYELLCSDPVLTNLLTFGEEGTDYTLDSNKQVQPTSGSNYLLAKGVAWQLGNNFIRATMTGEPQDLGQQYKDWNSSALTPKNDTFSIAWTDADKAEAKSKYGYDYDAYQAAYTSVNEQYGKKLCTGMLSAQEMKDAEKMLTDAGFDGFLKQTNDYYRLWQADPVSYFATH